MRTTRNAATAAKHVETREPLRTALRAAVRILGAASGAGAPDPRCANGPAALRRHGLVARLRQAGVDAAWSATIAPPAAGDTTEIVAAVGQALAGRAEELVARGRIPLVLGGDHSCAIGTWKGIARGLAARSAAAFLDLEASIRTSLGLVWIDAHMDAHTAQTSMSGNLHGMPLAC